MNRLALLFGLATLIVASPANAERRAKKKEKPSKSEKAKAERLAQVEDEEPDSDGPEAQAALPTKLGALIDVAVARSPDLAKTKADRAAAAGEAGAARGKQQWFITAAGSYSRDAKGAETEVEPFSPVDTATVQGSVGFGRNLPTGGNIKAEAGLVRRDTELAIPAGSLADINAAREQQGQAAIDEFFTTHEAFAKLTLTQPLLRGFGSDVVLAPERSADLAFTEATLRTQLAAEQMIFDIVKDYWDLAYVSYEVDVRAEALELANRQAAITKQLILAGTLPKTSGDAVTYEIATRSEALIAIQLELDRKSLDLRRKIGLDLGRRDLAIRPSEAFDIGTDEWDIQETLERSRKANRRLATLSLQRKRADVEIGVAKNAMLPQLDLQLSGGLAGNGENADKAATGLTGAAGFQLMAGIQVQFEIGGAAKAAHSAAVARKSRIEVEAIDTKRQLENEVVSAVKSVTAARARVDFADKAIDVATSSVKAERLRFEANQSDNFQVMQRQTQLIDARLARGRAVTAYHTAVAQLQYLSGTILEQYGVKALPKYGR